MAENVLILGTGCAGLTAAIYAARAGLAPLVLEGGQPGGQLTTTSEVENFPGFVHGVDGNELITNMKGQAERFGAKFAWDRIDSVDFSGPIKKLKGGEATYEAKAVIIATGSEVQLALKAQELLATFKIAVRVVSMPSNTTFDKQKTAYKTDVLPEGIPRIAVEMGVTDGWWKYGCAAVVGIDTYGESAPAPVLFKHFGFTPENVADTVRKVLRK